MSGPSSAAVDRVVEPAMQSLYAKTHQPGADAQARLRERSSATQEEVPQRCEHQRPRLRIEQEVIQNVPEHGFWWPSFRREVVADDPVSTLPSSQRDPAVIADPQVGAEPPPIGFRPVP